MTRTLARTVRSDALKLRRPLLFAVSALVVLVTVVVTWQHVRSVEGVAGYVTHPLPAAMTTPEPYPTTCAELGLPADADCAGALAAAKTNAFANHDAYASIGDRVHDARLLETPVGSGAAAAGMLASVPGFLFVLIVAAAHTGGEWSDRTLTPALIAGRSRLRFLLAKTLSTWATSVAVLLATWLVLALTSPVLRSVAALPSSDGAATPADAVGFVGRAVLVLLAFSVILTAGAVLVRGALGTFALGLGILVVFAVLASVATTARWNLFFWVTGAAGLRDPTLSGVAYWLTEFPRGVVAPTGVAGVLGLTCFAVVLGGISAATFHRSDILV